jgi:hypothetical protein
MTPEEKRALVDNAIALQRQREERDRQQNKAVREEAQLLMCLGASVVPIKYGEKRPRFVGWPDVRVTPENFDTHFPAGDTPLNLGILWGEPSNYHVPDHGLVDIDLDHLMAIELADYLLPPTSLVYGRDGKPGSHRIYLVKDPPKKAAEQFKDVKVGDTTAMLVEFRSTRGQSVCPPSWHGKARECVRWELTGYPAKVDAAYLMQCVGRLAAATILALHWPGEGGRQDAAMALAGALAQLGWDEDKIAQFLGAVREAGGDDTEGDDQEEARRQYVIQSSITKAQAGEKVKGWTSLAELLGGDGKAVVQKAKLWLTTPGFLAPNKIRVPLKNGAELWVEEPKWAPPVPLDDGPPVPAYPTDCLPPWMRDWVQAVAVATQTPPDLAANLALTFAAAGVARYFRLQMNPDWEEGLNLFSVTSMGVGELKSAVFAKAKAPIGGYEEDLRTGLKDVLADLETEREFLNDQYKKARQNKNKDEAKAYARDLKNLVVPALPKLTCDDESAENLVKIMSEQKGNMLMASPEATLFEHLFGRYSDNGKESSLDIYLKGHANDDIDVGRITRDRNTCKQATLSIGCTVQPTIIEGAMARQSLAGRGMLARFMFSMPVSLVGHRDCDPPSMPNEVKVAYGLGMLKLWSLEHGGDGRLMLQTSPEAWQAMKEFRLWQEPQLASDEGLDWMAGWANKMHGLVARLAGVLHLVEEVNTGNEAPWEQFVSEATMRTAVRLVREYYLPHAQAAFRVMGSDPRVPLARAVLESLRRRPGGCPEVVTHREIHQNHRSKFRTSEDLVPVLRLLQEYGWLHFTGQGSVGRNAASPAYLTHPDLRK